MDIFHVLTLIGGLSLFLFGMNVMGQALERRAGNKLRTLLDKMTSNVFAGFLTGLGGFHLALSCPQRNAYTSSYALKGAALDALGNISQAELRKPFRLGEADTFLCVLSLVAGDSEFA